MKEEEEEEEGEDEEEEGEYLFWSEAGQMRGGYLFGSGVELILKSHQYCLEKNS